MPVGRSHCGDDGSARPRIEQDEQDRLRLPEPPEWGRAVRSMQVFPSPRLLRGRARQHLSERLVQMGPRAAPWHRHHGVLAPRARWTKIHADSPQNASLFPSQALRNDLCGAIQEPLSRYSFEKVWTNHCCCSGSPRSANRRKLHVSKSSSSLSWSRGWNKRAVKSRALGSSQQAKMAEQKLLLHTLPGYWTDWTGLL